MFGRGSSNPKFGGEAQRGVQSRVQWDLAGAHDIVPLPVRRREILYFVQDDSGGGDGACQPFTTCSLCRCKQERPQRAAPTDGNWGSLREYGLVRWSSSIAGQEGGDPRRAKATALCT